MTRHVLQFAMSIGANEGAARKQIPGGFLPLLFISPLHFRVCVEGHEILIIKSHSIAGKTHRATDSGLSLPNALSTSVTFEKSIFLKKNDFSS